MIRRAFDVFGNALLFIAGALITVSTASLLLEVISRYFFDAPTVWSEDLAIFCFVWSTMFVVPVAFLRREHIMIDFVINVIPPKVRRLVGVLTDLVGLVTLSVIAYFAIQLLGPAGRQAMAGLTALAGVTMPLSLLYAAIPVGCILSVLIIVYRVIVPIPTPDPVDEALHAAETEN